MTSLRKDSLGKRPADEISDAASDESFKEIEDFSSGEFSANERLDYVQSLSSSSSSSSSSPSSTNPQH